MDITTKIAGMTLRSPLLPGSGPLTGDDERMLYLAAQGIGAIVTKTIAPEAAEVARPCIAGRKNVIYNSEAWSEFPASRWISSFLPSVREKCDTPIIASIGYDDEDLRQMLPELEPLVQGYEYIPRYVGKNFDEVGRITAVLRTLTEKPIWVKMNANVPDPVGFAQACRESGANGIVAITSLGPNMVVDLENRRPLVGTSSGYVWTSGPAIKPLALACVHMIKEAFPDFSVIASGGCATAEDVLEFLLAGADAVQMLSEAMLRGRDTYGKILAALPATLEKYHFSSVEEVKATGLQMPTLSMTPSFPQVHSERCTACGLCAHNCPYFALQMVEKLPVVDEEKCFGCGLCQTMCPTKAIHHVI